MYILLISTSCLLMILKLRKPINKYFQNLESFEKLSVQVFWTSNLFFFFITEYWICAMTRHYSEPNINILLTRNLPFGSDVRQWSQPLMIPLHFLWAKSNNRTHGQFECDVTWFCFCFDFVRSHVRCGCCSIVCLRFQVVQVKQIDWKMNTKNMKNYK